jgi:hypothetical protein
MGIGRSFDFQAAHDVVAEKDAASSYRDALSTVLDSAILIMLVPCCYLSLPLLSESIQNIGRAGANSKDDVERMSKDKFVAVEHCNNGAGGLITSLAKASTASEGRHVSGKSYKGIFVSEIYGHIFVISLPGMTTGNNLSFSMALLATALEVQT